MNALQHWYRVEIYGSYDGRRQDIVANILAKTGQDALIAAISDEWPGYQITTDYDNGVVVFWLTNDRDRVEFVTNHGTFASMAREIKDAGEVARLNAECGL